MKSVFKLMLISTLILSGAACGQGDSTQSPEEAGSSSSDSLAMANTPLAAADPFTADSAPSTTAYAPSTGSENDTAASREPVAATEETPAPADIDPSSIYAGVYSLAQADRGEEAQQRDCGACHAPDDWAQGRLLTGFTGQSLFDFVEYIRITMPMDAPGRLSYQEYVDIAAFILHINDVPAGSDELPADGEELATLRVEYIR